MPPERKNPDHTDLFPAQKKIKNHQQQVLRSSEKNQKMSKSSMGRYGEKIRGEI